MRSASTRALTIQYTVVLLLIALLFSLRVSIAALSHRARDRAGRVRPRQRPPADERAAHRLFCQRLSLTAPPEEHDLYRKRLLQEADIVDNDEKIIFAKGGAYDKVVRFAPELQGIYFGEPTHLDRQLREYVLLARKVAAVPRRQPDLRRSRRRHDPGEKLQRAARRPEQGGAEFARRLGKRAPLGHLRTVSASSSAHSSHWPPRGSSFSAPW